eukprot:COSAG01_NODE_54223_length_333_cov_1.311966_1_plen_105_part_10
MYTPPGIGAGAAGAGAGAGAATASPEAKQLCNACMAVGVVAPATLIIWLNAVAIAEVVIGTLLASGPTVKFTTTDSDVTELMTIRPVVTPSLAATLLEKSSSNLV